MIHCATRHSLRFGATALIAVAIGIAPTGCFSERSIPVEPGDLRAIKVAYQPAPREFSTRDWLRQVSSQLAPLLPSEDRPPLLTEDLVAPDGPPIDVYRYFRERKQDQHRILGNFFGLMHSAQAAGAHELVGEPPNWAGFEDVWVPVSPDVSLSGRFGLVRLDGQVQRADCIVLISGLFGDLAVQRTHDIAQSLLGAGHHVLALEMRGLGRTGERFPNVRYTYGGMEVGDLLAVDNWLRQRPDVRETGLVGHCWGANLALLAAWEDGRDDDDPDVGALYRPFLRPRDGRVHYPLGVMAFSPVVKWEELLDILARERWSAWVDPVLSKLQGDIEKRADRWGLAPNNGSLRALILSEVARSALPNDPEIHDQGFRYLRIMPSSPSGNKLEKARVPVVIVHAVNDPLGPAQHIADLFADVANPNVAGMVLAGGGHVGFAPYARAYFYNLLTAFFDPHIGVAARVRPAPLTARQPTRETRTTR
ncbi:MAG: alpha/beta fold hydrolase [Phycisphaerae bacterium]